MAARKILDQLEVDVMHRVAAGRTDKEIALHLGMTRSQVSTYVRNATMKAQAKTRSEAVYAWTEAGELDKQVIDWLRENDES